MEVGAFAFSLPLPPPGHLASPRCPGSCGPGSFRLPPDLGLVGLPGEWPAVPLFSSEKSCLITSKKLLTGWPGCRKKIRRKKKGRSKREKGAREAEREKGKRNTNEPWGTGLGKTTR